ncbi:MAG: efflux RND transporter periplasmic adaptor subunit [Pseudomonadota bacterium]
MKRLKRFWLYLLALTVCCAAGFAWWQTSSSRLSADNAPTHGAAKGVQAVAVQAVRRQDLQLTVNAIGSLQASNTALVRAQVGGVLRAVHFKEGEQVRAGQLLAEIDARAFAASVAQAEGALARDRAQLDQARLDLARYRILLAQDAIAQQQLETQEALVRQLEGTVKVDQAALDNARLQYAYTRVTAPIAGRVGLKQVDLGNLVQANDSNGMLSITQTQPMALVFSVPALYLPQMTARLRAKKILAVDVWARDGKTRLASGRVTTWDNAIDPSTDSIKVKALLPNSDESLFPNQAVSVTLQLDTLANALAVPKIAVLRGAQGFYVYVVQADQSVRVCPVQVGVVDGELMAVRGDLRVGEQVVTEGLERLRAGAKVSLISRPAARNKPERRRAASE